MPEWWTYSLSDFLLFSPRTYYRLFERHNLSVWPGQILTLGLGFLTVGLLRLRSPLQGRIISFILALLWAWVAWAFLWGRYASVNWAVTYLVPAFVAEALLFVWLGGSGREVSFRAGRDPVGILGSALLILSLALYPALAPLAGRPWEQAEIFGIAPDPTAIGTVGLVLLAGSRGTRGLLIVPIAWCLFSGATLWALGSREAWILLLAPALGTLALPRKRQTHYGPRDLPTQLKGLPAMNSTGLISRWSSWEPRLLSILRIVSAFLFIQYGSTKLLAFPAAVMPGGGTAPLGSLPGVAGALELVGGTLLLLGLFTRPVAFLLAGEMAFAYFIGHAPQGFWPVLNQGAPAILFCFLWLYISSAGPGPWSLDAFRSGAASRVVTGGRARSAVPGSSIRP